MIIDRDRCEMCLGGRSGTCGNKNQIDGQVRCDYCDAHPLSKEHQEMIEAIKNFIEVKGRFHTEVAYKRLETAYKAHISIL
jgi:hypothetical protein